ncbi:MAG: hypothetical protein CVU09_05855 [Bacteroidetes bacterium HGW-Bacteroidetes-4]|jgi:uncharacterized protein (TIGR02453 family)|nr:MAG: hypothetical protein CVU09_05855 [Bacteroidetes bacterium HGW-Bacteroidetes-4]
MLTKNVIPFLSDLAHNNHKNWFDANKERYQLALADFTDFVGQLIAHFAQTNPQLNGLLAKDCVFRIYRDVRFSKDKTPYKNHFGAYIAPNGRKNKLSGFYVHIEPTGKSFTGGGIFMPEAPVLKALRKEFYQVPEELLELLEAPNFKKYFSGLWDQDKLKTAPKGFPKDFEHIELLKYKSYVATSSLTLSQLSTNNIIEYLSAVYKANYPLIRLVDTIIEDAGLSQ